MSLHGLVRQVSVRQSRLEPEPHTEDARALEAHQGLHELAQAPVHELLAQCLRDAIDALAGLQRCAAVVRPSDLLGRMVERDACQELLVGGAPGGLAGVGLAVAQQHRLELLARLQPRAHCIFARSRQVANRLVPCIGNRHRRQFARSDVARQRQRIAPARLDALARAARGLAHRDHLTAPAVLGQLARQREAGGSRLVSTQCMRRLA